MGFCIVIRHRDVGVSSRRLYLFFREFKLGRALANDLLLLDPRVPEFAGTIQRKGLSLSWMSPHTECQLLGNTVQLGPFEIIFKGWMWLWVWVGFPVLILGLYMCATEMRPRSSVKSAIRIQRSMRLPAPGEYRSQNANGIRSLPTFTFNASDRNALELHVTPGNVEADDQISLQINGEPVGVLKACPGNWGVEERFVISNHLLRKRNTLVFANQDPNKFEKDWGVKNVYVTKMRSETYDSADPATLLSQAHEYYAQRASQPGQLWRARQFLDRFNLVWGRTHRIRSRKAELLKNKIDVAEKLLFLRGMSEANAALSVGNNERANLIFGHLLAEFVNATDPRRLAVERARSKGK